MTREETENIIELYEIWNDKECFCHLHPPCERCTQCPTIEDYNEAIDRIQSE